MGEATCRTVTRTWRSRGVEEVVWGEAGRCVLGHLDVAGARWLQAADVVVCPPRIPLHHLVWDVLAALPGCLVAAAGMGRHSVVAVRGVGELIVDDTCVVASALTFYWSLVLDVPSSAVSLSCTCLARGMRTRS